MYYSAIVLIALVILLIENRDIILNNNDSFTSPAWTVYRRFLVAVGLYYITDILWGILEYLKLDPLLFADTTIYFVVLAVGMLFWTQYAVTYQEGNSAFGRFLIYAGRIFFAVITLLAAVNIFVPVLFTVDESCVYRTYTVRHIILIAQILLLLTLSFNTVSSAISHNATQAQKSRYRTMALFGLIMAANLFIQLWFPHLPLYSVAYLLGTCLLHTFVIGDEKEEYKQELERALEREKYHHEELSSAWELAYTDTLTGVKSKLAYVEAEKRMDLKIAGGKADDFAVVVFDLNGLKDINDRLGHEFGDQYIIKATKLIGDSFAGSSVYRIGGDEFVLFLEGEGFFNRVELTEAFNSQIDENERNGGVVVAAGMSVYQKGQDISVNQIFSRADQEMYMRKRKLKEIVLK